MAISRQQKEEQVRKIKDIVSNAGSVVFVNFHSLSVSDANAMRQGFTESGVGYTVVKKTLARRALGESSVEGELPELTGELALAYSDDAITAPQGVARYQKELADRISPLGGIFESRYISAEEVKRLAAIPPREVLYGQFATVVNAPLQQSAGVLSAVVSSFVTALDRIAHGKT